MLNVIVTGKIAEDGLKMLEDIALVTVIENPTSSELVKALPTADAILHKIGKLPAHLLEQAPKLKIIARHGVGLDDLDLDYIKSKGIKLTTTDNANSNAVAELTIGLIISLNRRIVEARKKLMTAGFWQREDLMGRELAGQTLGLIGFGRIGSRVAEFAEVLRMKVIVHDPFSTNLPPSIPRVAIDELLAVSDVVSVHCPLIDNTRGMLNSTTLPLMRKGALLINTARGGIVDEAQVIRMVVNGQLAGAALDVFSVEPPSISPNLEEHNNLIFTPHIAAMTLQTQNKMATMAAMEIKNYFGR